MTTHRIHPGAGAIAPSPALAVLSSWLSDFRDCFTAPVWKHVLVLVAGTVLAPGKRTVSQALRVMGLAAEPGFARYHEVLNRARWNGRSVARRLLAQVLDAFLPAGEVVIGIDDTIERRWGAKIKARGIYRDPVRSSQGHFVKASGLRWLSLMIMVPIPWAGRRWALPFLTILAPSERWSSEQGRRHKKLTDWARQAIRQAKRWLPDRRLIIVADASFAALDLIAALRHQVCLVTRLRIDASLFAPAPPRQPGQMGRPRLKGRRLPKFAAVLANPKTVWSPITVTEWYGGRQRKLESSQTPGSGITPDYRQHSSVGCWYAIPLANASRKRFSAPISRRLRSKFSVGSFHAGAWRPRFRKCASTSASRRSGSGPIWRSCAPRRRCLACSH